MPAASIAASHRARVRKAEGIGWQQVHVAIDAASRRSYLEFLPSFSADDCVGFVRRAVAHFDACGIRVRRVLTDNGTGYKRRFGEACAELGIRWTRTKPYHPWTNGRAERFIRTLKRECLHGACTSPATRSAATTLHSGSLSTIPPDPTPLSEAWPRIR